MLFSTSIYSLLQNQTLTTWEFLEALDRFVVQPLILAASNFSNSTITTFTSADLLTNITTFTTFTIFDLDIFDEFQWKLCKILGFIVVTNIALIYFFWRRVYGSKIIDKFMQPSSSTKLIEELKNSISELKLPKEHSPRI